MHPQTTSIPFTDLDCCHWLDQSEPENYATPIEPVKPLEAPESSSAAEEVNS